MNSISNCSFDTYKLVKMRATKLCLAKGFEKKVKNNFLLELKEDIL
jgi:hypothetical protein